MGKEEDTVCFCPACNSADLMVIPEEEKMTGLGFYALYDFVGGLDKFLKIYRCLNCGYEW